jgi:hypothetical protein
VLQVSGQGAPVKPFCGRLQPGVHNICVSVTRPGNERLLQARSQADSKPGQILNPRKRSDQFSNNAAPTKPAFALTMNDFGLTFVRVRSA